MSSETTIEWLTDEEGRKYRLVTFEDYQKIAHPTCSLDCINNGVCARPCGSTEGLLTRDYYNPAVRIPTADLDALRALVANPPTCVYPDAAEDLARDADWCDWHGKLVEAVEAMGGQES